MRDVGIDPGRQRLVIGPDRPDQPLAHHRLGRRGGDQADPGGQHLLSDRTRRRNLHAEMVVTALPAAPGAGRVVTGLRARRGAPVGQVSHRRRHLLDELNGRMLGRPDAQRHVGDLLAHRRGHHGREVGGEPSWVGDDVEHLNRPAQGSVLGWLQRAGYAHLVEVGIGGK